MSSSELDPKILAKIKKCLALATSDNPNEAATAMRQAHALMSKHGLTAEAITQADIGEAQTASRTMARNKPSKWEAALAGLVANAFGCRMLIASMVPKEDAELPKRSQGVFNVGKYIFVGLKNQVEIAAYTAQVLTRKCQKARAAWIKEKCSGLQKKPGGRKQATALGDEFAMGWVWQISQLVQDFAHQPEIERAIDRYIEAKSAGEADESTVRSSKARKSRALSSALFAGIKAAQGEQLHRPVHAPVSQALLEFLPLSNEVESAAAAHARLVEQRWDGLESRVSSKLAQIAGLDRGREAQLLGQAANAKTATQRVHWLRKGAQAITDAVAPLAACRKGCSHCCSISVVISRAEASVIAKETGRKLNAAAGFAMDFEGDEIDRAREEMTQKYRGEPCVFLESGQCQIYEHRPLACRLLLNLDEDDLLCHLVPNEEAPRVPYLNTRAHEVRALLAFGNQQYDDIRAWFSE